jgi:hypothetical protein
MTWYSLKKLKKGAPDVVRSHEHVAKLHELAG